MSISDITKTMALYAPRSEFDQTSWKTAFDIANAFTGVENNRTLANDNIRKLQEMYSTQDSRVAFNNNNYQTGIGRNNINLANTRRLYDNAMQTDPSRISSEIATNNYNVANSNFNRDNVMAKSQLANFYGNNGYDESGRLRTPEELRTMMNGAPNINPQAFALANQGLANYFQTGAKNMAFFNPTVASQMYAQSGATDYIIDPNDPTKVISRSTDTELPGNLSPDFAPYFAYGALPEYQEKLVKAENQAMVNKAKTQELINLEKEKQMAKQTIADNAAFDKAMKETLVPLNGLALTPETFKANAQQLYMLYPNRVDEINALVNRVRQENNW